MFLDLQHHPQTPVNTLHFGYLEINPAETPLSPHAHVAHALGMDGMEALRYLAQPACNPRPMIYAMLNRLPIHGINT